MQTICRRNRGHICEEMLFGIWRQMSIFQSWSEFQRQGSTAWKQASVFISLLMEAIVAVYSTAYVQKVVCSTLSITQIYFMKVKSYFVPLKLEPFIKKMRQM